jgi:hypothetical protein
MQPKVAGVRTVDAARAADLTTVWTIEYAVGNWRVAHNAVLHHARFSGLEVGPPSVVPENPDVATLTVSGNGPQLRNFIDWSDRYFRTALATAFADEPFLAGHQRDPLGL